MSREADVIDSEKVTWERLGQERVSSSAYDHELANSIRNRRRLVIFLAVFFLVCVASLIYTFQRPAVFESVGVLNVVPAETHRNETTAEEPIDVQLQMLTNQQLLDRLSQAVVNMPGFRSSPVYAGVPLGEFLHVDAAAGSRIVELRATGSPPDFLAALVDAWIDVALEIHDTRRESVADANAQELVSKQLELKGLVEQKRVELDRFRRDNDIVSMEREENQILAQQKGIAQALNRADEELAAAKAELDAIQQATARGEPVVKKEDSRSLANLEQRAEELRAELHQYAERFKPTYMKLDPKIVALRRNLDKIEEEIRKKSSESSRLRNAEAGQAHSAARKKLASLRNKMAQYQRQTMDFTDKFNQYAAMKEELTQLEILQRDVQERLVKAQVDFDRIPELQVLDWASLPDAPIYPNYWRDAGFSLLGSLVLGIFAVLLHDFFSRPVAPGTRAQPWPVFYPVRDAGRLATPAPIDASLPPPVARNGVGLLEQEFPGELSEAGSESMLEIADVRGRLIIFAILSGLSLDEAAGLTWSDLDLEGGFLHVPGASSRTLVMPTDLRQEFTDYFSDGASQWEDPVWCSGSGAPIGADNLAAMIGNLAHDAGLPDSGQSMSSRLRHSYIVFLLRQGARLSELKHIIGEIPAADLSRYRLFSPPGTAVSLDQVEVIYPLLARMRGGERMPGRG